MARKFTFHGMEVEAVKGMSLIDFAKHCTAPVRRTILRNSSRFSKFVSELPAKKAKNKPVKTHVREMVVVPQMLDMHFKVYNGKEFADVIIIPQMLGRRLGEFSHTAKLVRHSAAGIGATRGSKAIELK